MKKIIAFAAILAGFAISCQKEVLTSEKTDAVQYTFNITVSEQSGFDNGSSTKSTPTYKSAWENGDKIFLFFNTDGSLLTDTYATLTYNGNSWGGSVTGSTSLGNAGTLSAVYVYKLDNSVTPSYSNSQWTISTGNVFYNCQTGVDYSISDNVISASLNLVAPADFVQFYIEGASGALTCDMVKGWKDVAIGSDMAVSNVTCTGYMEGFSNSGDSEVKEYYGRIVNNGTSLKNQSCTFSVVKNGKVYERTATPSSDARSFSMAITTTGDKKWTEAEGKLPGLFMVGIGADGKAGTADDVIVRFSKGNLYAKKESDVWKWYFYDMQYQYNSIATTSGSRTASSTDNEIDLFTWGYDATDSVVPDGTAHVTSHTTDGESFSKSEDWGYVFGGESSLWRTLTYKEWWYLFDIRTASTVGYTDNARFALAMVNGTAGIILLPDKYEHPSGVPALTKINQKMVEYTNNIYDETSWTAMESAGAVFLPAAGVRESSSVKVVGYQGNYWSSTAIGSNCAEHLHFGRANVTIDYVYRYYGYSVRLITESK